MTRHREQPTLGGMLVGVGFASFVFAYYRQQWELGCCACAGMGIASVGAWLCGFRYLAACVWSGVAAIGPGLGPFGPGRFEVLLTSALVGLAASSISPPVRRGGR